MSRPFYLKINTVIHSQLLLINKGRLFSGAINPQKILNKSFKTNLRVKIKGILLCFGDCPSLFTTLSLHESQKWHVRIPMFHSRNVLAPNLRHPLTYLPSNRIFPHFQPLIFYLSAFLPKNAQAVSNKISVLSPGL